MDNYFEEKLTRSHSSSSAPLTKTETDESRAELASKLRTRLRDMYPDLHEKIKDERSKKEIKDIIGGLMQNMGSELGGYDRDNFIKALLDDIFGFGPLQPLLDNPNITEIMVNGPKKIYIEEHGKIRQEMDPNHLFRNDKHVENIIQQIVQPIGRRCDMTNPMVDARLPDGSRVNAIIAPLALSGPTITIRKFKDSPFTIEDYLRFGSLTHEMVSFFEKCVIGRLNIVVSGGTGTGKTTFLNTLSRFIPSTERIVTVEDSAELKLEQEHVISLETRPANPDGNGGIPIRDLVKNTLRMRPDRIVVGEVRDAAALDMLQAMNTGHDGSLTTGHANSSKDMVSRLETMALYAGDIPARAIREQISGAIDLIIQLRRFVDGTRKIIAVTEVIGMGKEGAQVLKDQGIIQSTDKIQVDSVVLQDIIRYHVDKNVRGEKMEGHWETTGYVPTFLSKMSDNAIDISPDFFKKRELSAYWRNL